MRQELEETRGTAPTVPKTTKMKIPGGAALPKTESYPLMLSIAGNGRHNRPRQQSPEAKPGPANLEAPLRPSIPYKRLAQEAQTEAQGISGAE